MTGLLAVTIELSGEGIFFSALALAAVTALISTLAGAMMADVKSAENHKRGREVGIGEGEAETRAEAVAHGAAEYVLVNPTTGETEFRWKGWGPKA